MGAEPAEIRWAIALSEEQWRLIRAAIRRADTSRVEDEQLVALAELAKAIDKH